METFIFYRMKHQFSHLISWVKGMMWSLSNILSIELYKDYDSTSDFTSYPIWFVFKLARKTGFHASRLKFKEHCSIVNSTLSNNFELYGVVLQCAMKMSESEISDIWSRHLQVQLMLNWIMHELRYSARLQLLKL